VSTPGEFASWLKSKNNRKMLVAYTDAVNECFVSCKRTLFQKPLCIRTQTCKMIATCKVDVSMPTHVNFTGVEGDDVEPQCRITLNAFKTATSLNLDGGNSAHACLVCPGTPRLVDWQELCGNTDFNSRPDNSKVSDGKQLKTAHYKRSCKIRL